MKMWQQGCVHNCELLSLIIVAYQALPLVVLYSALSAPLELGLYAKSYLKSFLKVNVGFII